MRRPPLIVSQPVSDTVCSNSIATFEVIATGDNLTYSWQQNNIPIGITTSVLNINNATNSNQGVYNCIVSGIDGACSNVVSTAADLVVYDSLTINTQPIDNIICENNNVSFNVNLTGPPVITRQWLFNGNQLTNTSQITGAYADILNINMASILNQGTYQLMLTSRCGLLSSQIANLTVNQNITIDVNPTTYTVITGNSANFTVVAQGNITGYQWRKNGVNLTNGANISGALSNSLTINPATITDQDWYTCFITGTCSDIETTPAFLTVTELSLITQQPESNVTKCEGETLNLSIVSTGTTFIWRKNGTDLNEGGRFTGTNTQSLTINNLLPTDIGAYTCYVNNTESSNAATVIVNKTTQIGQQPISADKCEGDNLTLFITATGTNLSYQWQKNNSDIALAINNNYTINTLTQTDAGNYRCIVTGQCNTATSETAFITVAQNTTVTTPQNRVICQGETTNLTVTATGNIQSYKWHKNGIELTNTGSITGTNTNTLVITNALTTDAGSYNCMVTGNCGIPVYSNPATVTVNKTTIIDVNPTNKTVCAGNNVQFLVQANGSITGYQWYHNNNPITGANNNQLIINNVSKLNNGNYTCKVLGLCNNPISNAANLTVYDTTKILFQPVGGTICQDGAINLNFGVSGDNLLYKWYKNGSEAQQSTTISGIDLNILSVANAAPADAGFYSCNVTGLCGNVASNTVQVNINEKTQILTNPQNLTQCVGNGAWFTVAALGKNITYQWYKNSNPLTTNANISSVTMPTLNISNLNLTDSGSYTCIITGACGNVESNAAILFVNPLTQITKQPTDTTVCQGALAKIEVITTGNANTYLWKLDGNNLNPADGYIGINTNTLTIQNAQLNHQGSYTCTITGTCNTLSTLPAYLTVNQSTQINTNPISISRCNGDKALFTVIANGNNLSYQWSYNNTTITGANSPNLTIENIQATDSGAYTCAVTGTCGSTPSLPAILKVLQAPLVTIQPINDTVCEDNTAIFKITTVGENINYQWQKNNINILNTGNYSGTNTNILTINNVTNYDNGLYQCRLINTCGSQNSNAAFLTVSDSVKITQQPIDITVLQGNNAYFNITATGINNNYQWQKNNQNITDINNYSGTNTTLLTINNTSTINQGQYQCIITSNCGTITSIPAKLYVYQPVSIITQPANITVCNGSPASFTVNATGTITSYQWQHNGINLTNSNTISGTNSATLVLSQVTLPDSGTYTCIITGNYNIANTLAAKLTINQNINITTQPISQNKCFADNLVLKVENAGNNATYQWTKNNNIITDNFRVSGSATNMLVITNLTPNDNGDYRCTVSNICNSQTSNPAVINVNNQLQITNQPANTDLCTGQSANFTITATGNNLNYQWFFNGQKIIDENNIWGTNTANLIIDNITKNNQGNYACVVSDNCTSVNSYNALLNVKNITQITTQPQNVAVCQNQSATFNIIANGHNLQFQWQKNGANIEPNLNITGINSSVLIIQNTTNTDAGIYRCLVTGSCNNQLSNTAELQVNLLPGTPGQIIGNTIVCQNQQNVIYVVPEINNTDNYIWDIPYGATIVSGNYTRSIQVSYSANSLSGIISVKGQNSCGTGPISNFLPITVNKLPIANAGPDVLVCGNTVNLDANNISGQWSILLGDANINNPNLYNTQVTGLLPGINTFMWTVTQNNCTTIDTVNITNTTIHVDAGPNQTICSKQTTLNALTQYNNATWAIIEGSGNILNPSSINTTVNNLKQGVNKFTWSVNYLGCISADTVTIISDLPNTPYAGPDQIIDIDQTTMEATPVENGTIGTWIIISGSGNILSPNNPSTTISDIYPGQNTIIWRVQRNNCILADTLFIDNIMVSQPEAGPNQTICTNSTRLGAINPDIGVGEWEVISGMAFFDNKYNASTRVTNLANGNNWLKWTVRTSGLGIKYDSVLIVNNQPTTANAGPDIILCTNNFTLQANNPVFGNGIWTLNGGSGNIANINNYQSLIENLGQGPNELKWTITNQNCTSVDYVTITNNTPSTANAGVDQTICTDSTVLIPNTPSIGSGSWSIVSGSGYFTGNTVTKLSPNQNVLRYTITKGTCNSYDNITITNNKPTTPNAGYNQNICDNFITLNANPALQGSGKWSVISGAGIFTDTSANNTMVTNLTNGINIFRWTITKNNCVLHDEVEITNNFIQANAGNDITICQNNYQLLASNPLPGNGLWSIVGSSGAIFENQNAPNTIVKNLSNGKNTLRWTVNNNGCSSYHDVIITNSEPTQALAGENQSVCSKTALLNANKPTFGSGNWLVMSGKGVFDNNTLPKTTIRNLAVGQNTLRWVITNGQCSSYDEITITSNLAENVFAGNNQIACSDTAILSATQPTIGIGRWSIISGAGTFDNPSNHNTVIRNLGQGINSLKWTVSSTDCHVSDTVIITSTIPTTAIAGADQIICSDNTTLMANTPIIGNGQWVLISGSAIVESPSNPNSKVNSIALGNTILQWAIYKDGCSSTSQIKITNNNPSKPFAGYDTQICGDSVRLFAQPPTIGKGHWSLVSGDAVIQNPDTNQTIVNNIKFSDNTFRWTVTNKNCILYHDVIVTSNYEYVNAGDDRTVNTPNIQLIANKPSKGAGQWFVSASPATIEKPGNFETMVNNLGPGANIFTWSITNNGCTATDDIVINYIVMPVVDFEPSVLNGCPPFAVNFVNTSIGGAPYYWDFGDGSTSTEHSLWHTFNTTGTFKVTLKGTAPLGLTVFKDTLITVNPMPTANFEIAPKTIYIPGEHISCFNFSSGAESNLWNFGDGTTITQFAPTYSYAKQGIYNITLTVTSVNGCTDSMVILNAVEVLPRSSFFFPEAFTPSTSGPTGGAYNTNDRSNDVFYPIITDGQIFDYELFIYSRAGVMVFKTNNVDIGWDGYYKGKILPQDVYIYLIQGKYNNKQPFKKTGNVLLIVKE